MWLKIHMIGSLFYTYHLVCKARVLHFSRLLNSNDRNNKFICHSQQLLTHTTKLFQNVPYFFNLHALTKLHLDVSVASSACVIDSDNSISSLHHQIHKHVPWFKKMDNILILLISLSIKINMIIVRYY